MTTIAFRNWMLAADGLSTWRMAVVQSAPKIRRVKEYVFAASGDAVLGPILERWLEGGADPLSRPIVQYAGSEKPGMRALVIRLSPKPVLAVYDEDFLSFDINQDGYYAIGSGQDLALGAMACGAGAIEAVRAACLHDPHSGLPVSWFNTLTGEEGVLHG